MTPKNEVRLVLALERIAELLALHMRPAAEPPQAQAQAAKPAAVPLPAPAPDQDPNPDAGRRVLERLAGQGVEVRKTAAPGPLDHALAMTALFIGGHFAALRDFLGKAKSALAYRGPFTLDLKGKPAEAITLNCQLGTYLYKIAFLENYQYQKAPRYVIAARPSPIPAAQRFLTGQWFEIYCREKALALLRQAGLGARLDWAANVQATLADGEDFEFDFLLLVDEELFWFEQKTGCYQKHLERYAGLAQALGLDSAHAFLALLDVGEEARQVLGELSKMTVCDVESFEAAIQALAGRLQTPPDGTEEDEDDGEPVFHALPLDAALEA